ncbi:tRNA lysidine(34) synthetase TilS [Thalassovita aquimarina]|uniref:tRNA lysidine(34) synthetase TilS n=1 Tax=Thalassovita aquimarina TaxID=2785917 RepID=UPI00356333F8
MTGTEFDAFLSTACETLPAGPVGLAVSGGGDSMALMLMAAEWADRTGSTVHAVTVDHGLRPEAAGEAAFVGETAAALGLSHDVLRWTGWDGQGNLQDQARQARYHLLAQWAGKRGAIAVLLGHTIDDQAETLLMRLARGAGVDGLSAMAPQFTRHGVSFLRPLMQVQRRTLRGYLRDRGQEWIEDPSNEDTKFDRVKARQALEALAPLGLNSETLSRVAGNMAQARDALNWSAHRFVRSAVATVAGDLIIQRDAFLDLPDELARRVLVRALCWISGAGYVPRRAEVWHLLQAVREGKGATLHGCRMMPRKGGLHLFREYVAVKGLTCDPGHAWDGRWVLTGPESAGCHIAVLGEAGLALCLDWRDTGRPAAAVMADPAVWRRDRLIAAPLAGVANGWQAELGPERDDFANTLLSH